MKVFHFVSIAIFTVTLFCPSAWTLLTVGPNNVTVQAKQSTFMNCSTTSEGGVKWFRNGDTVCAELECFEPYNQRFHVEKITSTRSWNLIISSVKAEDAGDYRCEEIGFTADKKSAHLTVLEIEEKETTDSGSTVGLPHTTTASDATAGGTIAIIIGPILGFLVLIIIIIIIVCAVRKHQHRTRERRQTYELQKKKNAQTASDEHQQLLTVPTASNEHQQLLSVPTASNEHQQLLSVPTASNEHQQLLSVPTASNEHQQLLSVPTASNEQQRLMGDEVYFDQPILVKTIKTRIAEEKNSSVRAVAIFNQEVFVATDNCSEIEVYDVVKLDLKRHFTIDRLINPLDIKPCLLNNCLYIFDCEYVGQPGKMLKIDHEGTILAEWPMEDSGARLSVASNGNFIVSFCTNDKIVEYMSDGTQVREIELPGLCHAILLENRQFLISQGYLDKSELHRVFKLFLVEGVTNVKVGTNSARIIKAFGGEKGANADQVNVPWYMAVDGNGCVLVAERQNQRITLLSPTLEFKKILISEKDGLRRPLNMFMDIPNGRLFVTDFKWDKNERVDGQLLVFQIRNPANLQ